jgi:flagellar hook-basal body complex protein FliE
LSQTQNNSDALLQKLAAGEEVDLHQVMIATDQTDISFRVALAIRDRLVEAYREVSRMAV